MVDVDIAQATAQHFFRPAVRQTMNAGAFRAVQQAAEQFFGICAACRADPCGWRTGFLSAARPRHPWWSAGGHARPQVQFMNTRRSAVFMVSSSTACKGCWSRSRRPSSTCVDFSRRKTWRRRWPVHGLGRSGGERIKEFQLCGIHRVAPRLRRAP